MKVVKGIISTILTLIVIPILMVFIVYVSATTITSRKNVESIIKNVNVSRFLVDKDGEYNDLGKEIKEELVDNGLPEGVVDEFINSKQIRDFFSDYAVEVVDFVLYDKEMEELKAEDISKLINDNVDSIVTKLRERKVEGYEELTDEKIAKFKSNVDEISQEIANSIPELEESIDDPDVKDAFKIVRFIFGKAVYAALISTIAILLVFIFLLNLKRFSFLIWFGVIFILSSAPFVTLTAILSAATYDIDSRGVIDAIKLMLNKLTYYSLGFFLLGAALIVIAIILRSKTPEKTND